MHYDADARKVEVIEMMTIPIGQSLRIGPGITAFYDKLVSILAEMDVQIYVRERPIIYHMTDADRLYRIAGVSDLALWQTKQAHFYELAPSNVKRIITGNGKATKAMVASRLDPIVGPQTYETDDESDAVACGVAFLIKEGYLDEENLDTLRTRKCSRRRNGASADSGQSQEGRIISY